MVNMELIVGILMACSLTCLCHPLDNLDPKENWISSRSVEGTKSYSGYKLFRADVALPQLPVVDSMDTSHGVDVWSWRHKGRSFQYEVDVLTPPDAEKQVRQVFSEYELQYQEVINDLQTAINKEQGDDIFGFGNRPAHPMTWERYHSVDDMNEYLRYLGEHYPQLVTIIDIGQSFENRSLLVAKVSTYSDKPKPAIMIDGGVHAREWVSPATAMFILKQLVEFHWEHDEIIGKFDWYILPMANPDGYEYTRHHDRLWRKTRSVDPNHPGCVGVDANRNFDYRWSTGGSSSDPCSIIYAGPHAFSEPETRAVRDFLLEHKDQLKVYVSIHAYSQMWMLPWSSSENQPENYNDMYEVGKLATNAIKKYNGTQYTLGSVTQLLYVASGSSGDFAYGEVGIPFSYSLELRDLGRYGFILPKEQIIPTGEETFAGIMAMAEGVVTKLPKYQNPLVNVENATLLH